MNQKHPLQNLVELSKKGEKVGIYSACSANEFVIEAVLEKAKATNSVALIEATSNQCNQDGGYTGMTPLDFYHFIEKKAQEIGVPMSQIILGGDHLGPLTWTTMNETEAMEKAKVLVHDYVYAGFTKIHIDTSMRVADDPTDCMLSTEVIARRGATLARVATDAYAERLKEYPDALEPVYIVGSEVPIPGGSQEEEDGVQVTKVEDFKTCVDTFHNAFLKEDLAHTWERVIAVVVQPGVEFGDETVHEYNREEAKELMAALKEYPSLVFEGHSTDYQSAGHLRQMVEDGIAILKVGPALTFAMREGLFALAHIEEALFANTDTKTSNLIQVLEDAMLANPKNWKKHYHGDEAKLAFKRKYSFSDRARYYMPDENVQKAIHTLIKNIDSANVPLSLISQFMPIQYTKIRNGELKLSAEALIKDRIVNCIDEYMFASEQDKIKF